MSIFNYFQVIAKKPSQFVSDVEDITPQENKEVTRSLHSLEQVCSMIGKYKTWAQDQELDIGKNAIKHGVTATIRHFSTKHPGLKTQSMSDFKR